MLTLILMLKVMLYNLSQTNFTLVNGQKVPSEGWRLKDWDLISICGAHFLFSFDFPYSPKVSQISREEIPIWRFLNAEANAHFCYSW